MKSTENSSNKTSVGISSTTISLAPGDPPKVDFGAKNPSDTDDTTDASPAPLEVHNDGNVYLDIKLKADDDIWATDPSPTSNFRHKAREKEAGCYKLADTTVVWTDIPIVSVKYIGKLKCVNDSSDANEAYTDIKITVPDEEPPAANRGTPLTITAEAS